MHFYFENFIQFMTIIWKKNFQYGELEEINVCDNVSEHLIGNTYVKVNFYWLLPKILFSPFQSLVKPSQTIA